MELAIKYISLLIFLILYCMLKFVTCMNVFNFQNYGIFFIDHKNG